jgi:hypothetical protein
MGGRKRGQIAASPRSDAKPIAGSRLAACCRLANHAAVEKANADENRVDNIRILGAPSLPPPPPPHPEMCWLWPPTQQTPKPFGATTAGPARSPARIRRVGKCLNFDHPNAMIEKIGRVSDYPFLLLQTEPTGAIAFHGSTGRRGP